MLEHALTTFTSILFVVDPIACLPAYLVMTEGRTTAQRRRTARRASLAATLILVSFAATGDVVFRLFGVTSPAFQIAGGLLLFLVALDTIRSQRRMKESPGEVAGGADGDEIAITPLGIPMLAGPAALSTVTVLMDRASGVVESGLVYAAILLTGAVTYLMLRLAEPVNRLLGPIGISVLSRIFGLILAAIAVQFVLTGIRAWQAVAG